MDTKRTFTEDDIAYIERYFVTLESRPPHGPAPAYVLEDGRAFYSRDYLNQEMDEGRFKARVLGAATELGMAPPDADEVWHTYMTGIYGVCLWKATPENIVKKEALLGEIEVLLAAPREEDAAWCARLKNAVDQLDALERPFSPHFDREFFGRPPTRDSHIRDVRVKYPQIR